MQNANLPNFALLSLPLAVSAASASNGQAIAFMGGMGSFDFRSEGDESRMTITIVS